MSNLKYRLLTIGALVALSIWALFPRTTVERVKRNGAFVYDTVRRVRHIATSKSLGPSRVATAQS